MPRTEIPKSIYIGMARTSCKLCAGLGTRYNGIQRTEEPCYCCLRAITKASMSYYHESELHTYRPPRVLDDTSRRVNVRSNRHLIHAEFRADVVLTARRALPPEQFAIFKLHHVEQREQPECSRILRIDRALFFSRCTMLERNLGRAVLQNRIWPLDEYLHGTTRQEHIQPWVVPDATPARKPLRAPLAPKPAPVVIVMPQPASPVPVVAPAPAPEPVSLDLTDPSAVAAYVREAFSQGFTFSTIVSRLNNLGAPCPGADRWYTSAIKRILLDLPRLSKVA